MKTTVVVLAAGGSSRMGRPKLLLQHRGESLLRRAARVALEASTDVVVVVADAAHEAVVAELPARVIRNEQWQEGIASSIRTGVGAVAGDTDGVVILLADQPAVTADDIRSLLVRFDRQDAIVAASYGGTLGPPALFGRAWFSELLQLQGDRGARQILMRERSRVIAVDMPHAALDIDTPQDYEAVTGG